MNESANRQLPMDVKAIMELLPHRYPFLLVDRITALDPGKTITGLKNVSMNEPYFQGHFPGEPVMPGAMPSSRSAISSLRTVFILNRAR